MHYSSDILYELVKRESNGYYQLSFEEINIDVWNRAIKLEKVFLKPDLNKDFYAKGLTNLYDLELAGLHIDLESISSIYIDRKLMIENIRIIDPRIHIIREKNAPVESFSLQTGNLYKEVSDYLKVLRVDLFSIENAELAHSSSQLGMGNIDLSVRNFLLDSTSNFNQKFYSESLELEIRNQHFLLSDSIHQLSFDRFLLSTSDSVLTFENLVLKPIHEERVYLDTLDDKIIYNIMIPRLQLRGVDYFSAYRQNHLKMEELSLTDSHIYIKDQTDTKSDDTAKKNNSLLKELINIFDEVKVGKMRLINTGLNVKTNDDYNHNFQHVKSERVDIVLYDIQIDSSNYHFDYGKKYFEDVDINIKDYSAYLPDSIHTMHFDQFRLSSFDSSLVFKNFKISNNGKDSPSDMFLSIDLPLLSLKGLNFLDILTHQKLLITEMQLQQPNVVFEKKLRHSEKMSLSPDSIYAMIDSYLKVVGIQKLTLSQGVFSINNQFNFKKANLWVSNFNMHSNSHSWYDVLEDIELEMQQIQIGNKSIGINAGQVKLDRRASRLILDGLQVNYADQNTSLSGDLSKLTIAGINLDSLSRGYYLGFDSIRLNNPQFKVDILKPKRDSVKKRAFGNKYIEIVDGQVNGFRYDSTTFSLKHLYTDLTMGSHNRVHFGQAEHISFASPKSAHQLKISKLKLTRAQDLIIENLELHSIETKTPNKVEANGHTPAITLYRLNQKMIWEENKLVGDSLLIQHPDFNVNLNAINTGLASTDTEVAFQKIIVKKANMAFSDHGQKAIEKIKTPELSLTLTNFQYPQKSVLDAQHLLYADDVTLNVKNLQPIMTNGDELVIGQLYFNKKNALIRVDSLHFDQENSASSAFLPQVKIVGLDLDAYVNKQQLVLDSVQMTQSHISIDHQKPNKTQRDWASSIPELVDIKYFSSTATEIELRDSSKLYEVHKGEFKVQKFYAQGEITWDRFFDYSQYASASGENLSLSLGDGYHLTINQYGMEHPENTLTLNQINLSSDFTASEYSANLTIQKNWYDVSVNAITASGLDWDRSLRLRQYYAEKVLIDGVNALVYRDKTAPLQTTKTKALPQSILRNIDTWFYLDTLQVKGDITYQQRPAEKEKLGEISFNSLDASLLHVTTVDSMSNASMQLIATGQLMNTAPFEVNVMFDMQDPNDKFIFAGQIDQMQLGALNKMLRPVANINIKDGYAKQILFNITADNELARGQMFLRYDNLKIQILNPETNDLQGINHGIKTFFANTFVIKHKNPTFILVRPGAIFQQRDPYRAIFHYWGQALLSGAVSSIGINKSEKEEKKYSKESIESSIE
ncbi:hypothetical protein [Reichenbachiella agariperforans]|uniref:hypothetical protein n=1 Tax=Reichenbachiella agariperforans TaxID=156994 RepID=UPI001C0A2B7D|nr:hypothetical protein [Reichenbachiella agariperforans]MBU2916114.1 hypothetical protein [Reichenbachiella agariperforans]